MDTTQYTGWKPAIPVKSEYEVRIAMAEVFQGKNADDNGEYSTGMKFEYEIMGPNSAVLTNGQSAIGFKFEELLLEAKRGSSAKYVEMCSHWWHDQLAAVFGSDVPAVVQPEDYIDRIIKVGLKSEWSDFNQAEAPKVTYRKAITA